MRRLIFLWVVLALQGTKISNAETTNTELPSFTAAIAFASNTPPYLWKDPTNQQIIGGSVDAHEQIAAQLGYRIQWRFYDLSKESKDLADEFKQGKIDLFINHLPKTISPQTMIRVPTSSFEVTLNCLIRRDGPLIKKDLIDYAQYRGITTPITIYAFKYITQKHPLADHLGSLAVNPSLEANIQSVLSGQADYTVGERHMMKTRLLQMKLTDKLHVVNEPLGHLQTLIWINPQSPFADQLKHYDQAIQTLHSNNTFQRIKKYNMQKYIRQYQDTL